MAAVGSKEMIMKGINNTVDTIFAGNKVNLTDVINQKHENPKYLPGVTLPENIVADPSVTSTCKDADICVLCLPHQFVQKVWILRFCSLALNSSDCHFSHHRPVKA